MTKERFIELQTEIAKLKEIDKNTSDRVRATYSIKEEIEIPCSAKLDNEWANESI